MTQRPVEVAGQHTTVWKEAPNFQIQAENAEKVARLLEVAGGQSRRLIPKPLTSCPFTWKDQWWWLNFHIDLAAAVLQEENSQQFYKHLKEMHQIWRYQDAALSSRIRPRWIASSHDLRQA